MHTLKPRSTSETEHRPRIVKLLVVSKKGRIVVYSELQPSDDKVKVRCTHTCTLRIHKGYIMSCDSQPYVTCESYD